MQKELHFNMLSCILINNFFFVLQGHTIHHPISCTGWFIHYILFHIQNRYKFLMRWSSNRVDRFTKSFFNLNFLLYLFTVARWNNAVDKKQNLRCIFTSTGWDGITQTHLTQIVDTGWCTQIIVFKIIKVLLKLHFLHSR